MSEFKLPLPRRLLRCDVPRHDDTLVGHDVVFDEIALAPPGVGWVVALTGIVMLLWSRASRRLIVQGG